jgi:hypothetical protein
MIQSRTAFLEALPAGAAAADRGGNINLYGWLIGSGELDVRGHLPDGSTRPRPGKWRFGWLLGCHPGMSGSCRRGALAARARR